MPAPHLGCTTCRIRVRAAAPEIELLEGRCPVCEGPLRPGLSGSAVLGFRCIDLTVLCSQEADDQSRPGGSVADLASRGTAASARSDLDSSRWSDDGGRIALEPAALWPEAR